MQERSVISEGGEVIVPSSGETAEDISRASVVGKAGVILGGDLNIVKPNDTLDSAFLAITISNGNQQKELSKRAQGKSVVHISNSDLKDVIMQIPTLTEQASISNFFRTLDTTITLHKRKLDRLKELKKGYLQQMFPQNGERVPRVRFSGFVGDWQERKLGEVANFRRGSFPQPYGLPEWYDEKNGMPFVQVVDVGNNLRLIDDTKQKISKLAQPKSVYVPEGRVVVTLQGSIGRVAITQYPSYIDRTLLIFEDYMTEIDAYYWAYVIQQKFDIEKQTAPGGTIKTITKEVLSDFEVSLPCISEQAAIGNLFRNLDEQITAQSQKLEQLKKLKTAYLQKMFI